MKRIIYSLLLTVGISQTVMADAWSLDSCVNYALSHNLNIKNAEISRMQSELSVTEAKDFYHSFQPEQARTGASAEVSHRPTPMPIATPRHFHGTYRCRCRYFRVYATSASYVTPNQASAWLKCRQKPHATKFV